MSSARRLHALLMELEPGGMAKRMSVTMANEITPTVNRTRGRPHFNENEKTPSRSSCLHPSPYGKNFIPFRP
jgi:hypothetical protein